MSGGYSRHYYDDVMAVVVKIPSGKVMSYGQVADIAGATARIAGWAMANVDDNTIPWHRVVGADGYLRIGKRSPELQIRQRTLLEKEGVTFLRNDCVDMDKHRAESW